MSLKILSIGLLLLSVCLCFQKSAGNRRLNNKRPRLRCCTKVSSANITNKVIGETYTKQSRGRRCVEAIIFATPGGKVCVNPNAIWALRLIANMKKV